MIIIIIVNYFNFNQVEHTHPGFTYDLVMRMIHKADLSVNMNEAILRLQGSVSDQDSLEYRYVDFVRFVYLSDAFSYGHG